MCFPSSIYRTLFVFTSLQEIEMKKRKLFLAISLAFIAVPLNAECPPTPLPYTIIDPFYEDPATKYTGDIAGNGEAT